MGDPPEAREVSVNQELDFWKETDGLTLEVLISLDFDMPPTRWDRGWQFPLR